MTRLALYRCPGCGRALHLAPPVAGDLWCEPCERRMAAVARMTVDGLVARALGAVADGLREVADAVERGGEWLDLHAIDAELRAEDVAFGILCAPAWFTGRGRVE